MSEEEQIEYKLKTKTMWQWIIVLCLLLMVISFFSISVRRQICELTSICYYTCDKDSKTLDATICNESACTGIYVSCENSEAIKRQKLLSNIKSLFGLSSKRGAPHND